MGIQAVLDDVWARMCAGEQFDYEALLERNYRRWISNGDTAIDVGAHKGRHLAPMLECVGHEGVVVGVEPVPELMDQLKVHFNRRNCQLFQCALGSQQTTSSFAWAKGAPGLSGLRVRECITSVEADTRLIDVAIETLDNIAKDVKRLSFIKIDVEGGEIDCLKGSIHSLLRHRPLVSVEYGKPSYEAFGLNKWDLYDYSKTNNYLLHDIFLNDINSRQDWDCACDSIYWDFFLVPQERVSEFYAKCK